MRQCLFCEKTGSNREHVWPLWILEGLGKTKEPISHKLGKGPKRLLGNSEIKIRCVCDGCNNGWMSDLENASKPIIGSLMRDISIPLDTEQQSIVARWAVKTAMVLERSKPGGGLGKSCYAPTECQQLRLSSTIPARTSAWLARLAQSYLHLGGTDFCLAKGGIPGDGVMTNIIVGHLVIQLLTLHVPAEYADQAINVLPKAGQWEQLVVPIWPAQSKVMWPPAKTFTLRGAFPIVALLNRFKSGEEVDELKGA